MAEGGDDFDIPENADQILFVEDLISHIELQYPSNYVLEWNPVPFRQYIHNAFDLTVQNAIHFFENTLDRDHQDIFIQMQLENCVNSNIYERFAENLAIYYFPEGFDAKFFLIYCVHLCRFAAYFHMHGVLDAAVLARKHILKFLKRFCMLDGGWETVHRIAEIYAEMLLDSENIPTPQSPDSDESESDWPQNEASSNESNICLSEEQNVSSDNEDTLKEHQERACSIKEPFLKEYAQCSSESSNDTDLSSLEEPKSLEDSSLKDYFKENKRNNTSESMDKPRAGTSNGDKDWFILIKSDCRKRMDLAWNDTKRDNSRACIEGNKLIDEAAPDDRFCPGPSRANKDSSFFGKNDCKEKFDRSLNVKDNGKSETLNFEEENIDNSLLDDGLRTEMSNTAQISPNEASCKRKYDLSPDEENGANSPPMSSGGNNFNNKFEPNKKFVSEIPNLDKMYVSGNMEMEFSSSKESNATAGYIPPADEKESPELSSTSSDEERSPAGDGNL